jgi:hypothetical protein
MILFAHFARSAGSVSRPVFLAARLRFLAIQLSAACPGSKFRVDRAGADGRQRSSVPNRPSTEWRSNAPTKTVAAKGRDSSRAGSRAPFGAGSSHWETAAPFGALSSHWETAAPFGALSSHWETGMPSGARTSQWRKPGAAPKTCCEAPLVSGAWPRCFDFSFLFPHRQPSRPVRPVCRCLGDSDGYES